MSCARESCPGAVTLAPALRLRAGHCGGSTIRRAASRHPRPRQELGFFCPLGSTAAMKLAETRERSRGDQTEISMWRRYAFVRQHDQSDCGAAALATVAVHYRRPVGLEQMRDLTGTDRSGTNLRGMMQAAEKLGFAAKAVKAPYEALSQLPLPAIAHVKTTDALGHFVVLFRASKNSSVIADPARGVHRIGREEFCRRWSGVLCWSCRKGMLPAKRAAPARRPGVASSSCSAGTRRCCSRPSAVPCS